MNILFIHGIGEVGGAERELLLYMDELPSRGHEPTVICPEGGPLRGELAARGIRTAGAAFPPWRKLAGIWKRFPSVWALRVLLEDLRPDLVHVNEFWWIPQTLRAMPRALREGTPLVAHFRQDLPVEKVWQYELDRVDVVCAVSRRVAATLRAGGIDEHRIRVIHSGLGSEWFRPSTGRTRKAVREELGILDEGVAFVTVAHLFERKGYEPALRAFHAVVRASPGAHYIVVGTGDMAHERRLRSLSGQLGVEGRVHFVGFQTDVRAYLEAADVYVQPSLMEGFGIAVVEAMACGRPVVASETGGLPDIVVDGVTGALVPPGDADRLARAMIELSADSPRRLAMGAAGQRRVAEHFSVGRMMAGLTAAYESAVKRRAPSATALTPS